MKKITEQMLFDKSANRKILQYFNKDIDSDGFVIEIGTKKKVLTSDGEVLHIDDFGGIFIGSEIYIKSDIASIVKFLQKTTINVDSRQS